jgi:quinoprotein relay system zinc metallohydrolase 2
LTKQHYFYLFTLFIGLQSIAHAQPSYEVKQITDGIFYHQGVHEDATPDNFGAIANVGFIIGEQCVAIIDSGGSYIEGSKLDLALKRITQTPVCYVINTHVHPDHLFGNAAFEQYKPNYIGHEKLPDAIAARKTYFESTFKDILKHNYEGTTIIEPTRLVELGKPVEIDLGNRKLTLTAYQTSHTDHDLTVLDQKTKSLWTGDLLFVDRIPVMDGSINGWISVMDELLKMDINTIIPGHGKIQTQDWQNSINKQRDYFVTIRDQIRLIISDFGTIDKASKTVALDEKPKWLLFDKYHKRNITASFVELEWE